MPASGAVNTDSDGVLRRLMYVPVRLPAFAIRAAEMVQGRPIPAARVPDNHAWIDYAGPPGTYPTYSMADVLDGTVPSSAFAGKIVLVGVTAPIAKDVFTTSASSNPMSGVEVQANSIETALHGFPLQSADPGPEPGTDPRARARARGADPSAELPARRIVIHHARGPFPRRGRAHLRSQAHPAGARSDRRPGHRDWRGHRRGEPHRAAETPVAGSAPSGLPAAWRQEPSSCPTGGTRASSSPGACDQNSAALFGDAVVFMDEAAIHPGQEWPREIQEAVLGCRALLLIIGPSWLTARDAASVTRRLDNPEDWVRREAETGLARPEVAVIPILVNGASMPDSGELPPSLRPLSNREAFRLDGGEPPPGGRCARRRHTTRSAQPSTSCRSAGLTCGQTPRPEPRPSRKPGLFLKAGPVRQLSATGEALSCSSACGRQRAGSELHLVMIGPARSAAMRPEQVAVVDSSAVGGEGIENLVSGPGSLGRFRVPVPLVDSAEDVGFESADAAVRGATNLAVGQLSEPLAPRDSSETSWLG